MTTQEILVQARALIDTPDKWTQRWFRTGAKRCASGALMACNAAYPSAAYMALATAMGCGSFEYVSTFNDSHTHAEILAAFDRAIAATA